jgi:hypothetical protein
LNREAWVNGSDPNQDKEWGILSCRFPGREILLFLTCTFVREIAAFDIAVQHYQKMASLWGVGAIRLGVQIFLQRFDGCRALSKMGEIVEDAAAPVAASYATDEEQAMFSGEAMLYSLLLLHALFMAPSVPPPFHAQFAT